MTETQEQGKIAVLIDAENTNYKKISDIIQEVSFYGHIITKRAYGNWKNCAEGWVRAIKNNAITPIQQFENSKGKNSSDITLVIDAMDLLYSKKYDTFVIVSSDSDFTKLATRLRESQLYVFGVGQKKTPQSFISACDDFIYIENLVDETEESSAEEDAAFAEQKRKSHKAADKPKKKLLGLLRKNKDGDVAMSDRQFRKIFKLLNTAYDKYADDTGWADVSAAGSFFKRQDPGFDTVDYGFRKLTDLIEYFDDDFEMKRETAVSHRHVTFYYRPKEVR